MGSGIGKRRRAIGLALVAVFMLPSGSLFGYDLSHRGSVRHRGPITVALVPYAEQSSPELDEHIVALTQRLRRSRGLRVLSPKKTAELVNYYFTYVKGITQQKSLYQALSDARQAMLEGEFERAEELLSSIRQTLEKNITAGRSNEGLYEALMLAAKLHHANGDDEAVQETYDQIVTLYPDLILDPNLYTRWERRALKNARAKINQQPKASLKIVSSPRGSEVFLNGVHRGITPLSFPSLPIGRYCVEVKTVNHKSYRRYVDLEAGQALQLEARLARTGKALGQDQHTIIPSIYQSDTEISQLVSALGYHLGVDRIMLIALREDLEGEALAYRMGVTELGSVHRPRHKVLNTEHPEQSIRLLANEISGDVHLDVLRDPAKTANRSVGRITLHEQRKPFYKKPLFWVLLGSTAATGGVLGAVFGLGSVATTGGVVIGL